MKNINVYMDIQSLGQLAIKSMGKDKGNSFMNKPNELLENSSPQEFYIKEPNLENYRKVIEVIKQWCRENN